MSIYEYLYTEHIFSLQYRPWTTHLMNYISVHTVHTVFWRFSELEIYWRRLFEWSVTYEYKKPFLLSWILRHFSLIWEKCLSIHLSDSFPSLPFLSISSFTPKKLLYLSLKRRWIVERSGNMVPIKNHSALFFCNDMRGQVTKNNQSNHRLYNLHLVRCSRYCIKHLYLFILLKNLIGIVLSSQLPET